MRVKYLLAAASLAAMTAVVVAPGVSNANRGGGSQVEPTVQPLDEEPVAPVEEAPTPAVDEETPAAPVTEAPSEPVTTTTTAPAVKKPPVVQEAPTAPVAEATPVQEPTVVTIEPRKAPAPAAPAQPDRSKGRCHMGSYTETQTTDPTLTPGEAARAKKVDRNGNGTVCRKDIPGKGKGNTGSGSNIKDDQDRAA